MFKKNVLIFIIIKYKWILIIILLYYEINIILNHIVVFYANKHIHNTLIKLVNIYNSNNIHIFSISISIIIKNSHYIFVYVYLFLMIHKLIIVVQKLLNHN